MGLRRRGLRGWSRCYSSAPAAPSRWPVIDFVAVSTGWSPMTCRRPDTSAMSPTGVDVAWALTCTMSAAGQVGVVERLLDRTDEARPFGMRLHDVEAVGGDAGAGEPCVDPRSAGRRVLGPLENHDRRALAEDEAIAALVPRPRGPLRFVVAGRHRPHRGEAGDRQWVDDGLGATGDDHICAARPDDVQAEGDGLGTGGAGARDTVDTRLGAELESDPGRGAVGHEHRHRVRGHAARTAGLQDVVLAEQGRGAADPRTDTDGQSLRVEPTVVPARPASAHASWAAMSATASERSSRRSFTRSSTSAGSTCELRGDPHRQLLGPLLRQGGHARPAGEHGVPGRRDIPAERGGRAEPGDDYVRTGHGQAQCLRRSWRCTRRRRPLS